MVKEIILSAKYRLREGEDAQRLKLVYYQKKEEPPRLELMNGEKTPLTIYASNYNGNNPLEDPRQPENLRRNLKDLNRKLSDSGVFPPGFFEELNQRLQENYWNSSK